MWKSVEEIENILQNHGYSIDTIICDVMKTFKFKTICCQVGFVCRGKNISRIIAVLKLRKISFIR